MARIRDIQFIHPGFRPKVRELERRVNAAGLPFCIYETWRDAGRQQEGVDRGTSQAGPWHSFHNFGFGVDFVGCPGGRWSWDHSLPWEKYGKIVRSMNLQWGGDWRTLVDKPHAQPSTFTTRELREGLVAMPMGSTPVEWEKWLLWFWPKATRSIQSTMTRQLQSVLRTPASGNSPEALIRAVRSQRPDLFGGSGVNAATAFFVAATGLAAWWLWKR